MDRNVNTIVLTVTSVARTATAIIIVDTLSAKNILLNLLAVGSIIQADNLLGSFCLTIKQKRFIGKLVDQAKQDVNVRVSFLLSRILGTLPAIMMLVVVLQLENLLEALGSTLLNNGNCSDIAQVMSQFFVVISPFFLIFAHAVGLLIDHDDEQEDTTTVESKNKEHQSKDMLERGFTAARELSRNSNALGFVLIVETVGSAGMIKFSQERNEFFFLLTALVVNVIIFTQLNNRNLHSRGKIITTVALLCFLSALVTCIVLLQTECSFFNRFIRPRKLNDKWWRDEEDYC